MNKVLRFSSVIAKKAKANKAKTFQNSFCEINFQEAGNPSGKITGANGGWGRAIVNNPLE